MKSTDAGKILFLFVSLAIVALVLNNIPFLKPRHPLLINPILPKSQQQQQLEMQSEAAAQTAAAEHVKFLAQYLNTGFSRTPGNEALAVVVATEDGKLEHTVSTALANHFKTNTVQVSTSFFKPEFVSDKLFANVFDGSTEILNKLELTNSLDALLLARQTVLYSKTPSLDNLITADLQLEIQEVPITGNIQNQTWKFTSNGSGFSQTEANSMAEERLVKQIASDTNMSLGFPTN